jgi:hypothetical protein
MKGECKSTGFEFATVRMCGDEVMEGLSSCFALPQAMYSHGQFAPMNTLDGFT